MYFRKSRSKILSYLIPPTFGLILVPVISLSNILGLILLFTNAKCLILQAIEDNRDLYQLLDFLVT